jgi:hypothetical protein
MATHIVVRSFPGPQGEMTPGTEVDASSWRNTSQLVRRRYLRPIDRAAEKIPAPRKFEPVRQNGKR